MDSLAILANVSLEVKAYPLEVSFESVLLGFIAGLLVAWIWNLRK